MHRVVILDLLRFLAAMSILMYHYTFFGYNYHQMTVVNFSEIGFLFQYSYLGVELFFMISGFVILLSAENKTVRAFTISRIGRLYPAYWVSMTLTAVIIFFMGGERYNVNLLQYLVNLSMISDVFHVKNIDGVYWTLLIEIKFYFLVFLLMSFNMLSRLKDFLFIWLMTSIVHYFMPLPKILTFFLIPEYAPFFIAGAVFYMGYKEYNLKLFDYFILFSSYIIGVLYLLRNALHLENILEHNFSSGLISTVLFIFFIIFYLISFHRFQIKNEKKIYLFFGSITYPLYLIHENIGMIFFNNFIPYFNKYFLLIIVILLMLLVSYMIHIVFEKRIAVMIKSGLFSLFERVKKL